MRFFRTFSLLRVHRRTKSDTAAHTALNSVPQSHIRSHSFHYVGNDAMADPLNDVLSSVVPHTSPTVTTPSPTLTRPTLVAANARILELEGENTSLKDTTRAMATQFAALQTELLDTRSDLYAERHQNECSARQTKADQEEIDRYEGKLRQYEKFIKLLLNIGLNAEPVLSNAHGSLRAGEDADLALVESIKEAAATHGSPWATIISSVTGPRTPAQYVSALNLTLDARRELRESKKIAKFWRRLALEASGNAEIFPPSPSNISSIHEVLSHDRQAAVNGLLARRRCASRLLDQGTMSPPEDALSSVPLVVDPLATNQDLINIPPVSQDSSISSLPPGSRLSSMTFSAYVLPPLASESFKQELYASHSCSSRFSKRSPIRRKSGYLGEVDPDSISASNLPISGSFVTRSSKISVKTLGSSSTLNGREIDVSLHAQILTLV
jgi:hypothetical protein